MFDSLASVAEDFQKGGTIMVAMSGGIDSSVAASYLASMGCSVIGVTLKLYESPFSENDTSCKAGSKTCCAGQDIYDAKSIAEQFSFPHYTLDYKDVFKKEVIDEFINDYMQGKTPIPCIQCNQTVKFRDLLKVAKDIGASALVTGHYVRKFTTHNGNVELHKAIDSDKDQSYFLFSLKKDMLDFLRFPLGSMTKDETRKIARELNLSIANKAESQDICFVKSSYKDFIKKHRPGSKQTGKIIDSKGNVVGEHNGITNYTVGQRKGLRIAHNEPLYVIAIDEQNNNIMIGNKSQLLKDTVYIKKTNWLTEDIIENELDVEVKIRSTHQPIKAKLTPLQNDIIEVRLTTPQPAVSPGQACVIYKESILLGGGWIIKDAS